MKNLRILKQLLVVVGFVAFGTMPALVSAQDAQPSAPPSGAAEQTEPMQHGQKHPDELAKLDLSDDQMAQVQKIRANAKSQMDELKGDATLTADQRQAKIMQVRKVTHRQIARVLTPAQRQQMKADAVARHAARQQAASPPASPQQ